MRGCFSRSDLHHEGLSVLPAYAGMFPEIKPPSGQLSSSPRVCGDVSSPNRLRKKRRPFSPRMRGCFPGIMFVCTDKRVLPAYAGMFPAPSHPMRRDECSPRVCGDVSTPFFARANGDAFSPRMRGCFSTAKSTHCQLNVLPAYAGMFPGSLSERAGV